MVTDHARKAFARWLRGFRAHQEVNQQEMADIVGLHRTTIVRYETCKLYPSRDIRIRLNTLARETNYPPVPPIR